MSFPGHRALEKYVFWNMILNNIYFASSLTLSKTYIWQQDTEGTQGWGYVLVFKSLPRICQTLGSTPIQKGINERPQMQDSEY